MLRRSKLRSNDDVLFFVGVKDGIAHHPMRFSALDFMDNERPAVESVFGDVN